MDQRYDDAKVPLTVSLLKMIVKRSWTNKDRNINHLLLPHAMQGLMPFAMINPNKYQGTILNKEQDLLNTPLLISVADLCGNGKANGLCSRRPEGFHVDAKVVHKPA